MTTPSHPTDLGRTTGLPVVTVTRIDDPTAIGESIELMGQDAVQLTSRPLRAHRVLLRLGRVSVAFHRTNLPIRTHTKVRDGLVGFASFGQRTSGTVNGLPIGPDHFVVGTAGAHLDFVVAAGYESVACFVPIDEVHSELRRRYREEEFRLPAGFEVLHSRQSAAREFYAVCRRLVDLAARRPDRFEQPSIRAAAQTEVLESLFATLGSSDHVQPVSHRRTRLAHAKIVQIAENHALVHAGDHMRVSDLCVAADVSERTLQYAFKKMLGMSPITYLKQLRLHQVRRALRTATPSSTSVTKVAMRWGFWHLGEFSMAYKASFGELPSETLRQK